MAEPEEHPDATSASRSPTTARKISPIEHSHDAEDELKSGPFQHSIANAKAFASNQRVPSLDHSTLPSLPPPTDSSFIYQQDENEGLLDIMDEQEMHRHLDNVESSFMPMPSPVGTGRKGATDDSYLLDRATGINEAVPEERAMPDRRHTSRESRATDTPSSPPTPANAYMTPAPFRTHSRQDEDASEESGDTTSALESMSSSPTAAAAARTVSRAISMASMGYDVGRHSPEHSDQEDEADGSRHGDEEESEKTPRKPNFQAFVESANGHSIYQHDSSNDSIGPITVDAGTTPGASLQNGRASQRRPNFLRSRHASQRSSTSSFQTNPESQNGTTDGLGTDYALQAGVAPSASDGDSRSASAHRGLISRTISLGSMASGLDDYATDTSGRIMESGLPTLDEEEHRGRKLDHSPPETPRPSRSLAPPTDTVIAQHVRNVHVPESLAKEYRNKSEVAASKKMNGLTNSSVSRNGKNLTLKEQSSTIDRLSRENFDLKLKVMFLSDRLDKLSEEGVKEMISENVELKTGLAVMQRDNKALRRKVKDLERQLKDDEEERPTTAQSGTSADASPKWFDQDDAIEREEELVYLRERVEEYVTEIDRLKNESLARETEKRNLTNLVRTIGERRVQNVESREEMDVWKDLLESETARREQSDEDNKRLRDELFRLKSESTSSAGLPGLNHTTNIYNITKKRQVSPSRPKSGLSERTATTEDRNGTFSAASTMVEELRKESEQLRHENAELRREVGAQTNMLTSRNREKERLYQEIEDLKLNQKRAGTSVAGESIFERSVSRAQPRSLSRASGETRQTFMTDEERDDFENKQAELRDTINSLKIKNHDLQQELASCMRDFEAAVEARREHERNADELREALDGAEGDLVVMQQDRDEALLGQEEAEHMFEDLQAEAQNEIDALEGELEEKDAEIERLTGETERLECSLADKEEDFVSLQNEMRQMSQGVVRLEDDQESSLHRISELEKENESLEQSLVEANGKIERFIVEKESNQGEIAFLREEQDGDKIKIGDLEAANRNLDESLELEKERANELEERLASERHHREMVASQEKQEVQKYINELNREVSVAKEANRRIRKDMTSTQVEATEYKQKLAELENNLRESLGDLNGTRSSILQSITKLQRELERNVQDLDATQASLAEKDRLLKQRDAILENAGLESRKLADMLDKERQAHRSTKHTFETYQKTTQHTTRTLTQQEARVIELENSRQHDRKKIATLESSFKEQLTDRNNLLLALWNRLSALCGSDWAHNNSLINGRALPSLEAVATMLPGFSKNLLAAVKTIETLVRDFEARVKDLDKRLWKEYQSLENKFELQTSKVHRLETMTRSSIPAAANDSRAEIAKLRDINRALKTEVSSLRAANEVRDNMYEPRGSPAPAVPTGPRNSSTDGRRTATMTRSISGSVLETPRPQTDRGPVSRSSTMTRVDQMLSPDDKGSDPRWQVRLKELETKLKAEREARKMDRSSAQQRLREKDRENADLAAEIERGRVRHQMASE